MLADVRLRVTRGGMAVTADERGPNAAGHDRWLVLGDEQADQRRTFVAASVTWWNKRQAVVLLFEGQHRMASRAAQGQEEDAFRAAARHVLDSVK